MKALLSIKPEFVDKIISGEKKYEYRKRIFKQKIEAVVIYCTMPVLIQP
jgi:predicted transcriptional regulator